MDTDTPMRLSCDICIIVVVVPSFTQVLMLARFASDRGNSDDKKRTADTATSYVC